MTSNVMKSPLPASPRAALRTAVFTFAPEGSHDVVPAAGGPLGQPSAAFEPWMIA